jgi:hypothetical protein
MEEVQTAIQALKSGKCADGDGLIIEMLQLAGDEGTKAIYDIIGEVLATGKIPKTWKMSTMLFMHKKEDPKCPENYRGLSIVDLSMKVFARIILTRIQPLLLPQISEIQHGFIPGKSVREPVATILLIIERMRAHGLPVHLATIDLRQAFDRVNRKTQRQILEVFYRLDPSYLDVIDLLYTDTQGRVRHEGELSDPFVLTSGVKQGCLLSPLLFIAYMDFVVKQVLLELEGQGIRWNIPNSHDLHLFQALMYADDVALLAETAEDLEVMMQVTARVFGRWGLVLNATKCAVVHINTKTPQPDTRLSDGTVINRKTEEVYLGCLIAASTLSLPDFERRYELANNAFFSILPQLRDSTFSRTMRGAKFECAVLSIFLYNSECWALTQAAITKCSVKYNTWVRIMAGVNPFDHEPLSHTFEIYGLHPLETYLRSRRLQWYGHLLRMAPSSLPRLALAGWPLQDPYAKPGSYNSWRKMVDADLVALKKNPRDAEALAQDRPGWHALRTSQLKYPPREPRTCHWCRYFFESPADLQRHSKTSTACLAKLKEYTDRLLLRLPAFGWQHAKQKR